jgi:glutamate racemase
MSSQVILAFDSGVGGLSALAPLLKNTSGIELFYFGDLAHLPYGSKSTEAVRDLVGSGFKKLLSFVDSKNRIPQAAILACNTASAVALDVVQELSRLHHNFPVIGVIESGSRSVLKGAGQRIVILGTQGTVKSEAYLKSLEKMGSQKPMTQKACPLFVPLVEENLLEGPATEWIVDYYLKNLLLPGDDVILGCTHYPFLQPLLEQKFPKCRFFNAGQSLLDSAELASMVSSPNSTGGKKNKIQFLFSDESVSSVSLSELLFKCGLGGIDWSQLRI